METAERLLDTSVGKIARLLPGATAVFHAHQLDFCCGGKDSLRRAATERQLDAYEIAQELQALQHESPTETQWNNATNHELIDFILERYHDVHRQQLPELIRLAARVEYVHGSHPHCPNGLSDHLQTMLVELESHMQKEEQILFPMLAQEPNKTVLARGPVSMMRLEHDEHGAALRELHQLTNDITLPKGACNTWRALYLGLETLEEDLMNHIHLENNILFERVDGAIESSAMHREAGSCCGSCG